MTKRRDRAVEDPGTLAAAWRAGLATIGVLMTATGAYAVFKTKVEAGPTALITIGAVLTLIAAGGRAVTHFKVGDNEVDMARREAVREEIIESSENEPPEATLARAETAYAYDPGIMRFADVQEMTRAARRQVIARRITELLPQASIDDGPLNFDVHMAGATIHVQVLFKASDMYEKRDYIKLFTGRGDRVLLVLARGTRGAIYNAASALRGDGFSNRTQAVLWASPEDDPHLQRAVEYLASLPPVPPAAQ